MFLNPIFAESTNQNNVFSAGGLEIYGNKDDLISSHLSQDNNLDLISLRNNRVASSVPNTMGSAPRTGVINIPVLFVNFSDEAQDPAIPPSTFDDLFNSSNYLNGNGISVKKYIESQSYYNASLGQGVTVNFVIYPTIRTLPQTRSFYTQSGSIGLVVVHAVQASDPYIDFSQYDADNDGKMDGLIVIRPGTQSTALYLPTATTWGANYSYVFDGKTLGNSSVIPQKITSTACSSAQNYGHPADCRLSTIIAIHEFMHVFGLPDLYEICNGAQVGMGLTNASMMTVSRPPNKPINLDPWSKFFLGWVDAIDVNSLDYSNFNIPSPDNNRTIFILRNSSMNPREFFIVSNRTIVSTSPDYGILWQPGFPPFGDGGVEIYHVDEQYISEKYVINEIMCDPDGQFYSDAVSHPGIVFEKNVIFNSTSTSYDLGYHSFYYNGTFTYNGTTISQSNFDAIQRLIPPSITFDATSKSYNGQDTNIVVQALTGPSSNMPAILKVKPESLTPEASVVGGLYYAPISVSLSTTQPNTIIYYTTDGSTPTSQSQVYTTPISVNSNTTMTIKARSYADGYLPSQVMTHTYQVTGTVTPVVSDTSSGDLYLGSLITLSNTTLGSTIKYTLDGSDPTLSSLTYGSPIILNNVGQITLKTRAFLTNWQPSEISTYNYNVLAIPENKILSFGFLNDINILNMVIDHDQNLVNIYVPYNSYISDLIPVIVISENATITPDPSIPQNFYNNPIEYTVTSLLGSERTYVVSVIRNPAVEPVIVSLDSGSYSGPQQITLSTATPGAVIRYTLDGSYPLLSSPAYVGTPITITDSCILKARAYKYIGPTFVAESIDVRSANTKSDNSKSNNNSSKNIPNVTPASIVWLTSYDSVREYEITRGITETIISERISRNSNSKNEREKPKPEKQEVITSNEGKVNNSGLSKSRD